MNVRSSIFIFYSLSKDRRIKKLALLDYYSILSLVFLLHYLKELFLITLTTLHKLLTSSCVN